MSPLPCTLHVPWDTPAGARPTRRVGGRAGCGVPNAARPPRSQVGHVRPSAARDGSPPEGGGWGVSASGCPQAAGPGGGQASPRRGGGFRVFPQGVGGMPPAGDAARGREDQRVARGCLRPGAVPRRLSRSDASPAPGCSTHTGLVARAVSPGRWAGGGPRRRGRDGVRGPARPVAWSSSLGVRPTATVPLRAWHPLGLLPGWGAPSAQPPSRCAGQTGRRGAPRRQHVVPMRPLTPGEKLRRLAGVVAR